MLFLIPVRAGSKRLPGKNVRMFCGLPLWRWSLATAHRCSYSGDIISVNTDHSEILELPPWDSWAISRPEHLCGDDSPTQALIDWCWDKCCPRDDTIVLLQPTSPTRSDSLVRKLIAHGGHVRSVTNGEPNGACWVYRRGQMEWVDIETEQGHDIDTLEDFQAAEQDMLRRFA